MTTLLVDTSVVIKWFHREGEAEVAESRALRDATVRGEVDCRVLDLAMYELGNVLLRALGWSSGAIGDQLQDVVTVCGAPLTVTADWLRRAAILGERHQLTFYDAAWAAAAEALDVVLVSADAQLVGAGLAESPTTTSRRLRLPGVP